MLSVLIFARPVAIVTTWPIYILERWNCQLFLWSSVELWMCSVDGFVLFCLANLKHALILLLLYSIVDFGGRILWINTICEYFILKIFPTSIYQNSILLFKTWKIVASWWEVQELNYHRLVEMSSPQQAPRWLHCIWWNCCTVITNLMLH